MKNKILLSLILSIFLISFASAAISNLGTFKQGTCVDLLQTCAFCTYNNITSVVYPNSTNAISGEIPMTKIGTSYNYTFCNTTALGKYIVNGHGDDNTIDTIWNYEFEVNPLGIESTTMRTDSMGRGIWIIFGIAVLLFLAFLFTTEMIPLRWTYFILSIIFMVVGLNLVVVALHNEVVDPTVESLFDFISAASFYLYWFAGGMILIIWILSIFNTMNQRFAKNKSAKYGSDFNPMQEGF